ncbi:MAG: hypothetical protein RRY22_04260 [Bacilli bacterium]
MEKAIMILNKHADKTTNKIIIPKAIICQWGNDFYMEIYKNRIVLKPILCGKEN